MIFQAALFLVAASGGEGASCRVDADCMGGLACTTDRVCASLRPAPAAAPRREVVEEQPTPRRERRIRAEGRSYRGDEPVPAGMHLESRPRLGLIIGGAVVFGVFWILDWSSTIAGCYGCNDAQIPVSFVPVFGPFIQLALLRYRTNVSDYVAAPFLVIDGVLQGLGAGLLLGGLFSSHKVLVYDGPMGINGVVTPIAMPGGGAGLGTVGTF